MIDCNDLRVGIGQHAIHDLQVLVVVCPVHEKEDDGSAASAQNSRRGQEWPQNSAAVWFKHPAEDLIPFEEYCAQIRK